MTSIFTFPDLELVAVTALAAADTSPFDGLQVGTHLVPDWDPPYWQVRRVGGAPEGDITDIGILQLHSYGTTRQEAWTLSAYGVSVLMGLGGRVVENVPGYGRVLLDFVDIVVGSSETPELDPDDRRVVVDLALACRRHTLTLAG